MFERTWRFAGGVSTSVRAEEMIVVWNMLNCDVARFTDLFNPDVLGVAQYDEFMDLSLVLNLEANSGDVIVNDILRGELPGGDIMRVQLAMKDEPVLVGFE